MKLTLVKFLNEYFIFNTNVGEIASTYRTKTNVFSLDKEQIEELINEHYLKTGQVKKEWNVMVIEENNQPKVVNGFVNVISIL
jgi:acetylglutamate kinase